MKYYFDPEFEKGYKEYRLKKYRGCNHFLVHCKTINYNGRLDDCYICIKCTINEIFKYGYYNQFDDFHMFDYLKENNGLIPGFRSKTDLLPGEVSDVYQQVIKTNPKITNKEFEEILKVIEKGLLKNQDRSRRRTSLYIEL